MKLIAAPLLHPGCCATCQSSSGPVVDTLRNNPQGERIYVCRECIRTLEQMLPKPPVSEPVKTDLEAEVDRLKDIEQAYDELRRGLHYTIQHGGFVIRRGKIALRTKPGHKAVDLDVAETP